MLHFNAFANLSKQMIRDNYSYHSILVLNVAPSGPSANPTNYLFVIFIPSFSRSCRLVSLAQLFCHLFRPGVSKQFLEIIKEKYFQFYQRN